MTSFSGVTSGCLQMLCAVADLQEGRGQTSRELFPQLPPVRAALSPGFCVLYLTSRQGFVWSQGCNIIPAHSPVLYWQSGWAHYRRQNKRWLLILSLAACSETPLLFLISGSVCVAAPEHRDCKAVLGRQKWKFYPLGLINPLIPSCLSPGTAQVLRAVKTGRAVFKTIENRAISATGKHRRSVDMWEMDTHDFRGVKQCHSHLKLQDTDQILP